MPGCGKTTLLSALAKKALKKHSQYKNVYCNIKLNVPGLIYINISDLGRFDISNGLVLIDEATLQFDSRDYKNFSKNNLTFFLLHRHYNVDIVLFTQQWDGVDRKIRVITDRVYYVYKGLLLGHWFTRWYRVPYGIIIPDPTNGGEKLGEIVQGYCKPGFMQRLFGGWLFRPLYYKYFDSWEAPKLPPLPRGRTHQDEAPEEYLKITPLLLPKEKEAQ